MEPREITIQGASQHNLKHIDVAIPRHNLVVLTGVSGSGKSTLAFDTLYAEGQRRYVESLGAFARQFIGQLDKPRVEHIGGLSPAIAIEQKSVSKNPRSTVGTVTEVMDYLRVLFARVGTPHCPECGREVHAQSAQQIAEQLAALEPGTRFQLLAPLARARKGTHADLLAQARADGYARVRVNGELRTLDTEIRLNKKKKHTIELVVDRLVVPDDADEREAFMARLADSVESTLAAGDGVLLADLGETGEITLSEHHACAACGISFPELSPQLFSFNSPIGMCPSCNGLGSKLSVDPDLLITDPTISILDGAVRWYGNLRKGRGKSWLGSVHSIADHYGVDLELPWNELPQSFRDVLLHGSNGEKIRFVWGNESDDGSWSGEAMRVARGMLYHINRLYLQTQSEHQRRYYRSFMSERPCPDCGGARLRPEARAVRVSGTTLERVGRMAIEEARGWIAQVPATLDQEQRAVAEQVLKEIADRLQFMLDVGLHYLTLDRASATLSGGEGQRIRLASQIGSGLVGVTYILDEPSIGLHARDNRALLNTLLNLRDLGNTVLVVEHDAEIMNRADWLIDMGPGAGLRGGEVVAAGPPCEVAENPDSLTGAYLSGREAVTLPMVGRHEPEDWITLEGARLHNLRDVTARIPLGVMTVVTGVSGSGKSSLITQTLQPALASALQGSQATPGPHDRLLGLDQLDKVITITQEPIGRTPRSNPATYIKVWDGIRALFAQTPEARARGYKPGRFSFNVKGGRCESCRGYGRRRIEMHFLADVWVTCRECGGSRFNRETLSIRFKGRTIAEVMEMEVPEALEFFENQPRIRRMLQTLHDVGLDYIRLGQPATTLSGGEAQRIKLARELSRVATGRTIYLLDEPTTGLHFADIQRLLDVLHRLVEAGNSVLIIEHNLDVIRAADWIIDLGPEGGDGGGTIVAEGTPETVAASDRSHTGRFLREVLDRVPA